MGQSKTENADKVSHVVDIAALPKNRPHPFALSLNETQIDAVTNELDLISIKKLRFEGEIWFDQHGDVCLAADLGATVTQPCVVTLDPVRTRLDAKVTRRFSKDFIPPQDDRQMLEDEDETLDPLGESIDLGAVLVEAIALNLPDFPRVEGAELKQKTYAEPGVDPLEDEDVKPFSGLASLRDKLAADKDER